MSCRERRSWTADEDQLLRDAIRHEDPDNPRPSRWHAIAKHVPGRSNKDCRKRWLAQMASKVMKGGWTSIEDQKLMKAIEKYGPRWSLIAAVVQTRNSDQCAKRWTDALNPEIDWSPWTPESSALLLRAVSIHGKCWTKIVKSYFPGRTALSAKNQYNSLTRLHAFRKTRLRKSDHTSCSTSAGCATVTNTPQLTRSYVTSAVQKVEASDWGSHSTSYSPISELAVQDIPFDTLENWSAAMLPLETGDWELDFSQKITSSFGPPEQEHLFETDGGWTQSPILLEVTDHWGFYPPLANQEQVYMPTTSPLQTRPSLKLNVTHLTPDLDLLNGFPQFHNNSHFSSL